MEWIKGILSSINILDWLVSKIKGRKKLSHGVYISSYPQYGLYGDRDIGRGSFSDVEWLLRLPTHSAFVSPSPSEWAERLQILGPYCPKCKTELRESRWLLRRYHWQCDGCSFKKISKVNMRESSRRAKLIYAPRVRGWIEEERAR